MVASTVLAVLPVVLLFTPFLLLWLLRLSLRALGWSLQAQSRDRKAAITARVQRDTAAVLEQQPHLQDPEAEDGWEKIEKAGSADNGQPLGDEWSGVVGFFHPFW